MTGNTEVGSNFTLVSVPFAFLELQPVFRS